MKISYLTFGCKLNQAETDNLRRDLENIGFATVKPKTDEKICIIRACGVTSNASKTTRECIRAVKKRGAYIVATGCLEDKKLKEIDYIGKNNEDILNHIKNNFHLTTKDTSAENIFVNKTRAFVKIQTGCNFQCAYCIIPFFRGKSISLKMNDIITELKLLEKEGYQEVILTGVNICQYNEKGKKLADLLKEILAKTSIPRFRLGSLDPRLIDDKLMKIYKNPRLLPHWHLSLQSGSNKILKLMNRGYTSNQYAKIVEEMRKLYPNFSFTTDIIVGFPGEEEKDFQETLDFVKRIRFTKVHIFPFSPRPGTPAEKVEPQVQAEIKKERTKILSDYTKEIGKSFISKFYGQTKEILFEQKKSGFWFGYAPEYFKIKLKSTKNLHNKIIAIKITTNNSIVI